MVKKIIISDLEKDFLSSSKQVSRSAMPNKLFFIFGPDLHFLFFRICKKLVYL